MNIFRLQIVLLILLSMVLGSCVTLKQPRENTDHYILEYDSPQMSGLERLPFTIRLNRFDVAPVYNTHKIIYRDKSFKRAAYPYSKWRANPGDLVTYFLTRDLKDSRLFQAVVPKGSRIPTSYLLEGTVEEFLEKDSEADWEAILTVSIVLSGEDEPDVSKRVVFQKTYNARETCEHKNPSALAKAMSEAMAKISADVIRDIYKHTKDL